MHVPAVDGKIFKDISVSKKKEISVTMCDFVDLLRSAIQGFLDR